PIVPLPRLQARCFLCRPTSPTDTYTLSLHDALPICLPCLRMQARMQLAAENFFMPTSWDLRRNRESEMPSTPRTTMQAGTSQPLDRKSTRLNSSHRTTSYAVCCLQKKTTVTTRGACA